MWYVDVIAAMRREQFAALHIPYRLNFVSNDDGATTNSATPRCSPYPQVLALVAYE